MTQTIIAVCALVLTVYSIYATIRHNRLSVMPHLSGYTNKLITNDGLIFSYDISNNGIGPARIKNFVLFRHGKPFPRGKGDYVESIIREHLGNQLNYQIRHNFNFGNDASFKAGDTRRIVEIFFPGVKAEDEDKFLKSIDGLDLRIEYESFYGQKFVFYTKDQDEPD